EEHLPAAMREIPQGDERRPRILGVHLEGPFLSAKRLGTHVSSARRDPDVALLDTLLDGGHVRLMTLAPELPGADALIDRLLQRGVIVSLGHSDATAAQANAAFVRGPEGVLAGSVLTMIDAVRNLHALGVPLEDAVAAASTVPGRALGDDEIGRLDVGLPADVVVLDDHLDIARVLVGGEVHVAV